MPAPMRVVAAITQAVVINHAGPQMVMAASAATAERAQSARMPRKYHRK